MTLNKLATLVKQGFDELENMIKALTLEVSTIKGDTTELKLGQQDLKNRVNNLEQGQIRLENKVEALERGQEALERGQDELILKIDRRASDFDVKELTKRVDKIEKKVGID